MVHKTMELRALICETFPNSIVPEDITNLRLGDLPEWDSLGNFNLIMAIEREYNIQFDIEIMEKLTSVKDLEEGISNALSQK